MTNDAVSLEHLRAQHNRALAEIERLKTSGGGGTLPPMEGRVSKLEAYMEESRADTREIRGDLKAIIGKLGTVATKADVSGFKWQWIAASVALFAIIVGTIVGGLGWLAAMIQP